MARRLAFVVAATAVLAAISLLLYGHWISSRAQFMLRTARAFSEQREPITVTQLEKLYGTNLVKDGCGAWKGDWKCAYSVTVSNRVLAALRLAPYTELKSNFWLQNGIVYENMLDYMTNVRGRYNVVAHAAIAFNEDPYFAVHPWDGSAPLDSNGLAHISAELSNSRKLTVLALDTSCLTRIRGCTTIAELLPSVWQRTINSQIKCVVPNHEGWVIAPADWPWAEGAAKQ